MAKARARVKGKKKRWFQLIAPKLFKEQILGEIYLAEPSKAIKRTLKLNLMNLTGDIKRQNVNIKFKIKDIGEGKLYTQIIGYEMVAAAIKKMVRRRSSKAMISFLAETSDKKEIRIKPLLLTRGRTKQSILTSLRKTAQEAIKAEIKKLTYSDLIENLVNHRFQTNLKRNLSKIYPLRAFEVKEFQLRAEEKPAIKQQKEKPKKETMRTSG